MLSIDISKNTWFQVRIVIWRKGVDKNVLFWIYLHVYAKEVNMFVWSLLICTYTDFQVWNIVGLVKTTVSPDTLTIWFKVKLHNNGITFENKTKPIKIKHYNSLYSIHVVYFINMSQDINYAWKQNIFFYFELRKWGRGGGWEHSADYFHVVAQKPNRIIKPTFFS